MGTEYWIADLKNKRRFGLGKGGWRPYCDDKKVPRTLPDLYEAFTEAICVADWVYAAAERAWAFCVVADWEIEIRSEHNETGDWQDWPEVDDRYVHRVGEDPNDPDPCAEQTAAALERARKLR